MEISEKNFLEKLADKIPGLKGYRDKEERRDTDQRLRTYMASRLDKVKDKADQVKLDITNKGNLQALNDLGTFTKKLQRVTDSIRYASYGYSGLFDQMKIREAELSELYNHDLKILDAVGMLEDAVQHLAEDFSASSGALQAIDDLVAARKTLWEAPKEG